MMIKSVFKAQPGFYFTEFMKQKKWIYMETSENHVDSVRTSCWEQKYKFDKFEIAMKQWSYVYKRLTPPCLRLTPPCLRPIMLINKSKFSLKYNWTHNSPAHHH